MNLSLKSLLFGLTVGDALGVPVEFYSRDSLKQHPVKSMQGYGTHNQPLGTWSDDSSLSFCLAEAINEKFSIELLAKKFVAWYHHAYWTAHDDVFDIGISTQMAFENLVLGINPINAGGKTENSNGNGSLMRISPLVYYIKDMPINQRFELTKQVSSITHGHIRSILACFYFLEFLRELLITSDKKSAYFNTQKIINEYLIAIELSQNELQNFDKLLKNDIGSYQENKIESSGYVVHTIEASMWCLMTTKNYKEAVLNAVNLGGDTDTTASVTGAMAGLLYGYESIPSEWINLLAKKENIEKLCC